MSKEIDFNKVLDILFNETTINYYLIDSYFNNDDNIKYFFISILKEFTPEESLIIFNNKTPGNSNLNILFTENLQYLLNHENVKKTIPSFNICLENVINYLSNNNFIMTLLFSVINFIIERKTNQFSNLNISTIKQILFYPTSPFLLENVLILIENLIARLFKTYELKQYTLSNLFSFDFILSILNEPTQNNYTKLCVLYYVYNINFQYDNIKDKIIDPSNLCIFQHNFYSHFSFLQLYQEVFVKQGLKCFKLENMLFSLSSTITQFFADYDLDNQIEYIEDIDKEIKAIFDKSDLVSHWKNLFYVNPFKVAISTLQVLSNQSNEFNYYDLEDIYTNIMLSYQNNNQLDEILTLFIRSAIIVYIIFNLDMKHFFFIIRNQMKSDEDAQRYITQFNSTIIIILFQIKSSHPVCYNKSKQNILYVLNDVTFFHDSAFFNLIANNEIFNDKLIQFIIDEVEESHISLKYFDNIFKNSKDPNTILNGLILLGHWANKYPIKYIYTKILDVLYMLKKTIDLRTIFTNENKVSKFIKGLFLLFKAFPKLDEDFMGFVNYLKNSISNLINDYSLSNYTKEQIDKLVRFINGQMKNSTYRNNNTFFIHFK